MVKPDRLRVLIALDSTTPQAGLLRALSSLTRAVETEFTVLFIQDEDALRAASLPFVREVSLTGEVRETTAESLLAELQHQARRVEQQFARLAQQQRLLHQFQIAQGRHVDELLKAAAACDFVVISRALRPLGLRARPGSELRSLMQQRHPVLLVNEPWESGSSVVVLLDEEAGSEAEQIAARYAADAGLRLVIISLNGDEQNTTPALRNRYPDAVVLPLTGLDEQNIVRLCARSDARLLVIPGSQNLDWSALVPELADRLPCSILRLGPDETKPGNT